MVLVKEKNNQYIQYRFGKKNKIELEFPTERNADSWKLFSYNYYMRGGGKANSGQEIANMAFTQNGFQYLVYSTYFSEDESMQTGILITNLATQKRTRIKGIIKTRKESLFYLQENSLLKLEEDGGLDF
ncbi:hypothetical protein [Kaistella jeonii]|uniref:Uncharacterized protein n=1 Tax=Kaistella jeonii TaxID=266749 RepID=A0A0C1F4D3_9FLAO|nr:hypothetical protein [Kaistella jeonii]KIA88002.1 hypothetical protein OA86_13250 [Kaistella jeonii]SFC08720.1 hypothetical protein SAMN05421876_10657 [Kaistella jeonii]VEI95185.1 Uncharacterised protein [Kaistella jeonii]